MSGQPMHIGTYQHPACLPLENRPENRGPLVAGDELTLITDRIEACLFWTGTIWKGNDPCHRKT